jgi:hypothetical protein
MIMFMPFAKELLDHDNSGDISLHELLGQLMWTAAEKDGLPYGNLLHSY